MSSAGARKVKQKDLTVETPPTGWIVISAIVDGFLVRRKYGGYSRREACRMFRDEINGRVKNGLAVG